MLLLRSIGWIVPLLETFEMKKWCVLVTLTVAFILIASASTVTGQDKKASKNKQLPQNWGKLGLSEEQKKKIYAIQDDYGSKIADLRKQIDDLTKKERAEMAAVLSSEQKEQLKKILTDRVPDTKPSEKKPGGGN